jgi:hypothetical protein
MIAIPAISVRVDVGDVIRSLNGKIESFFPGAAGYEGLLRTVATTLLADVKTRIHEKGIASDGSAIGQYSTKPMYVSSTANIGSAAKFGRPIGKTGRSKFQSGKRKGADHASRYFPGGYNEFKTKIGRNQLGSVNLSLSGDMNSQLTVQATSNGFGFGWPDGTGKGSKFQRAGFLEKKYGKKIWGLTDEEKVKTISLAKNYVIHALS